MNAVSTGTEVAVVYSSRVVMLYDHAEATNTLTQTFDGPRAKARALQFLAATRDDFPESDGWHSFVWANEPAREAWTDEFMASLFPPATPASTTQGGGQP